VIVHFQILNRQQIVHYAALSEAGMQKLLVLSAILNGRAKRQVVKIAIGERKC